LGFDPGVWIFGLESDQLEKIKLIGSKGNIRYENGANLMRLFPFG